MYSLLTQQNTPSLLALCSDWKVIAYWPINSALIAPALKHRPKQLIWQGRGEQRGVPLTPQMLLYQLWGDAGRVWAKKKKKTQRISAESSGSSGRKGPQASGRCGPENEPESSGKVVVGEV